MNENLGVSLSQYALNAEGLNGFGGMSTAEDIATLQKSMTAGSITGRDTETQGSTGGAVLKVESLENQLKNLTFRESDIVLWKKIPKLPAKNTVEEYALVTDYGSVGNSFIGEGELPEEDDARYLRKSQIVKYMGTTRRVSHPMTLVDLISGVGNGAAAVQSQVEAGTMKILRDMNKAVLNANSELVPQEFNGIYQQHKAAFLSVDDYYASSVVIDLKGKALKDADVQAASLAILENYGYSSLLMGPPGVLSSYVTRFHGQKLISPNSPEVTAGVMGQAVTAIVTQFGTVNLGYDLFMAKDPAKTTASSATSLKAPLAPTADGSAPSAVVSDATTKFTGFLGDHAYAVTAVNRFGESALTTLGTVTIGAGQVAHLKFTATGSPAPATSFNIYRSELNKVSGTVKYYKVFSISIAELSTGYNGAGAGLVKDKNHILPNTDCAFMTDPTTDVFSFKQLLPLMKMDLAITGPSTSFMILLYGTPIVYAPKKIVKFINIGTDLS